MKDKGKGQEVSYTGVIYNHLMGIVSMAYLREDASTLTDTLWAMLDPWLTEESRNLWKRKSRKGGYQGMMWKIRCCMLALYKMEALPRTNIKNPEETMRYYEHIETEDDVKKDMGIKISEYVVFKDLIMRYLYLFTELIQEGADMQTLQYMVDLGYCFATPYVSWEEQEEWKSVEELETHPWKQFIDKYRILMGILDRESLLFERRVIDTTTMYEETQHDAYITDDDFNDMFPEQGK